MLQLSNKDPHALAKICHALSTELRLNIIALLENDTKSCLELSKQLGYPLSTISANVKILEEAGLIITELLPAKNGSKKLCSLVYLDIAIQLGTGNKIIEDSHQYEMEIPIGNYMDFQVFPSCGFVTDGVYPETYDKPNYFFDPSRVTAQLIWLRRGYLEYRIPIDHLKQFQSKLKSISFELEICSEAPGFNHKWKSDITMWINEVEIGTWTSPADFGDRRGILSPDYWSLGNSQYGILTKWKVNTTETTLNNEFLSDVHLKMLKIYQKDYLTMKIGIKDDSQHIGGINIFGKNFGDYPQDIKFILEY